MNRLTEASSPYLRQHADNPIDWWEWCNEAFDEARRREIPVLLSIGYAACHWCHVMAAESFTDEAIAAQVNAEFVAIKVDRQERPDIDAVYMAATQAMTGRGGWPMTCFLTADAEPFHCGTYYPPTPRSGIPSFRQVLTAVTSAWRHDRDQVDRVAGEVRSTLERTANADRRVMRLDDELVRRAAETLHRELDPVYGGFGGAPKFPPGLALEFLLRHHERTGSAQALGAVQLTCERMARGALYDQLAGGFARYTSDKAWAIPHFEKMLYDNALLLRTYTHLARRTGSHLAERVARETAQFLLTDLWLSDGALATAIDADAAGVEGLTYLWTRRQLVDVLGSEDGAWAAELLQVTDTGTFGRGQSTLQLPFDPNDGNRCQLIRNELLSARKSRPQPARDDNVITAFNGMAAQALAEAGAIFGRSDWIDTAAAIVQFLLNEHRGPDSTLRRSSIGGQPGPGAGILEDYACLAEGAMTLYQVQGTESWLDAAFEILDCALDRFADPDQFGKFFDVASDISTPLHRPRDVIDNATPSGGAAMASALLTASALTDGQRSTLYRSKAEAAVNSVGELIAEHPRFTGHWLATAEAMLTGPLQVAIIGEDDQERHDLLTRARMKVPGGGVVVWASPEATATPLLADRTSIDAHATAFVCFGFVCAMPVTAPDDLEQQLVARPASSDA
jgi:uncharacterized protein YyaL (SSP411 family)